MNDISCDDESKNKFECLKLSMEIFYTKINTYMNMTNNNLNDNELEKIIDMIIKSLKSKFEELKTGFKQKNLKLFDDTLILEKTYIRLKEMYSKSKLKLNLDNNFNTQVDFLNHNETNSSEEVNQFYQSQIITARHNEYTDDKEQLKKIINVKNQIKDLTNIIELENSKASQSLILIENNVDEHERNVEKTNEELRKAAIHRNNKHKITYPLALGSILGVAGSFLPGIGNLVGASVGLGIGYAVSKLEKKAITKIEPEKYK